MFEPQQLETGGWRLSWESQPGNTYVLRKWNGNDLSEALEPRWIDIATVTATGDTSFADDLTSAGDQQGYYQVVQLSEEAFEIEIVGAPELQFSGWKITWTSIPGKTYALQRWTSDDLGVTGNPPWTNISMVTATGATASAIDATSLTAGQRFYRIILAAGEIDTEPPLVSAITAVETTLNNQEAVILSVSATDNQEVAGVTFFDGTVSLGEAVLNNGQWEITVPIDPDQQIKPYFIARAVDTTGNESFSPTLRYGLKEVDRFAVLDSNGEPTGEFVEAGADGTLPPFEYRPAGRNSLGTERDLSIQFTQGGKIVVIDGKEFIEFTEAEAEFGPESPMQFLPGNGGLSAQSQADPKRLPVGPLTMEELATALDYDPEEGIPVTFYDTFPMLWKGGTLDDAGIKSPRFSFMGGNLPLPEISGDYSDFRLNFSRDREIRLPFYGEFFVPDGSANPPGFRVGADRPLWLTLRPDRTLGIRGFAEIVFPGGGRLKANIIVDDPFYRLQIVAESLHVPFLDGFADALPENPEACLPTNPTDTQLDSAEACLRAFCEAYRNFSVGALAVTPLPEDLEANGLTSPPDDIAILTSALDAWVYSGVTPVVQSQPAQQIQELLRQIGQSASGSREMNSVLRYELALLRAKKAMADGDLDASSLAEVDAALDEAEAAARLRAQEPDAIRHLDDMLEAAQMLAEIAAIRAALGDDEGTLLTDVVPSLLQNFTTRYTESLGVEAGVFTPEDNPAINGMNRFVVYENLSNFLEILGNLAALGFDETDAPVDEAMAQLGLRLFATASAGMDAAEAAEDVPGFTYAFADMLDLLAYRDLAIFPDNAALDVIPPTSEAGAAFAERLNTLMLLDFAKPRNERSYVHMTDEIRRILKILREVPPTVTFESSPILRVRDYMNEALDAAFTVLTANDKLSELLELLEAGTIYSRLERQFADTSIATTDWDTSQLPQVVQQLASQGREQRGWSETARAVKFLLDESARIQEDDYLDEADQNAVRLVYQQQAAVLLQAAHDIAVAIWQSEESRRAENPLLFLADLALPGDIFVDQAAGSISYDRQAHLLSGAFKGRVRLPKFDGTFNIIRSSINSGGAFDITAFGSVGFPGGQLTVPVRRPVHLHYDPSNDVGFSGGVNVALDNGMSFGGHLILDDPLYGFGIEARGLRFDLANQISILKPAIADGAFDNLASNLRNAYTDYYASLSGTLETLVGEVTDLPPADTSSVGEPPDFEAPQITLEFDQLNAWANAIILSAETGVNVTYDATLGSLKEQLQLLTDQAREAQRTFGEEIRILENQLERAKVRRKVVKALDKAAEQQLIGDDAGVQELVEKVHDGIREELKLNARLLDPNITDDLGNTLRHIRVMLDLEATIQESGGDFNDLDEDGQPNESDNCPAFANGDQADGDNDGIGDACDPFPNDSQLPEAGPCREYLKLTASPLELIPVMLECARQSHFAKLGLNPETGEIQDASVFNALSESELQKIASIMLEIDAVLQITGTEAPAFSAARVNINNRRHTLLIAEYNKTSPQDKFRRYELAKLIDDTAVYSQFEGDDSIPVTDGAERAVETVKGMSESEIEELQKKVEKRIKERNKKISREIARDLQTETDTSIDDLLKRTESPGFFHELGTFLEVMFEATSEKDQVYLERISSFIRFKVRRLRQESIDPEFLGDRLREGLSIAETLSGMTAWAVENMPDDIEFYSDLEVALENTTISFTGVAETERAWWLLNEYLKVLNGFLNQYEDQLTAATKSAFDSSIAASLEASDRIADAFVELMGSVSLESVVFKLPGDLVIQRAFGSVLYNRETELLSGRFGGRIEFPEVNAFFEIRNATLASDGSFSIDAETGGPLPFGSGVSATAQVEASGSPDGQFFFEGTGELSVVDGQDTQQYSVTVRYDSAASLIAFDTDAEDVNLRFTDDFVLYGGGLGFEVSTARPEGRFVISGSAGIGAIQKPLPEQINPEDFYVNILDTSVAADLNTDGFQITLERGFVTLPEIFEGKACDPLDTVPFVPSGVGLSEENPIFVSYQSDPQQLEFGGTVLFNNLGMDVPGIDGLRVAICIAELTFDNTLIPEFHHVNGAVEIPLPDEPVFVDIEEASWTLDGFPMGTIALRNDVEMFNAGGFALDVIGQSNELCPDGTALAIESNNGEPFFRIDGGLRFTVPADVLTDDQGGELFTQVCAGINFGFNSLPELEIDSLAIGTGSDLRLGGNDGLLIRDASLVAENIQNLFNQSSDTPFVFRLSGGFQIPDGPGFTLQNAKFTFIGEDLPLFSIGGATLDTGSTFEVATGLPLELSDAGFSFKNQDLPLNELVNPENLVITLSASLGLPPEEPVVSGQVQGLTVTLQDGVPVVQVSGIGLGIQDFEIPPLSLTGEVFIGGLGPDEDIYFAGNVGGTFQGAGVEALLAFNLHGPLGCCFSINAGPAGIPLGQTGILFTGAEGGVSFLNTNGDPCDFQTFINVDSETGRPMNETQMVALPDLERALSASSVKVAATSPQLGPNRPRIGQMHVMTWEELREMRERARIYREAEEAGIYSSTKGATDAKSTMSAASYANAKVHDDERTHDSYMGSAGDSPSGTVRILAVKPEHPVDPESLAVPSGRLPDGTGRWPVLPTAADPDESSIKRPQDYDQRTNQLIESTNPPFLRGSKDALTAADDGALEIPCPTGECPPETVNILCQPHPDTELYPDRIIVKFTSLTEDDLNEIGITRSFIEQSGLTTAQEIGEQVGFQLREFVEIITPRPDPDFTGPNGEPIGEEINQLLDEALDGVEAAFASAIEAGVQSVLGDNDRVYDAILEAAYAGVRCPDATIKLTGTFSHLAVSSFLSGTGGVVLSTTGSAGLVGEVNLFGMPVGFLDGFVNATDSNGDPNPSMCGVVRAAVGPLELGALRALFECEGCVTGVLESFANLAGCLSQEVVDAILPKVAPELVGLNTVDAFNAMTDDEKLAFLGEMFSLPPTPGTGQCFFDLVVNSLGSINPEFSMCGGVQPKLFGFPLTGSAVEVAAAADKTSMAGQFSFSSALFMGSYSVFFPIGDKASFGFGIAWPNPDDLIIGGLSGRFSDPAAFAAYLEESFAYMLENATYTVGFELSPFGLKGFQSGARIVMPNLTNHPEISGWIPPEDRGENLPSRLELMIAAVENDVLANPLWKGTAEDIQLAFTEDDPRRQQVQGLSFSEDYFPHGGVVGAARLGVPKAIVETPPESLTTILDPGADLVARLTAALDYVQNYILDASEVGTLGFYLPAPNPPIFTDGQGNPLPPKELLDQILTFDPEIGISTELYPLDVAFLQGYLEGQLLGIPIARAKVVATPPTDEQEGQFLITSEIPDGSWMQSFVDNASMTFEMRQPPPTSIEEHFAQTLDLLQQLVDAGASDAEKAATLENFVNDLNSGMPKAAMDLQVNNFRIPNELAEILSLDGSTAARFVAYTPQYDPETEGDNPLAIVRRNGGVALQARLRFADLVTIDNAELAVFPGKLSLLTGLPAMAGRFDVPLMPLAPNLNLRDALLDFNSEAEVGSAYVAASGNLDPIQVQPLLEIVPLNENQSLLGGTLSIIRSTSGPPASSLSIDPSRVSMPAFAEGLSVEIHGVNSNDPFTFSTEGPWDATVSLVGGLVLRDPVGTPVLQLGSEQQTFTAAISGNALESASITLSVPAGIEATAFPGLQVEQTFAIGDANAQNASLTISSDGTFELFGGLESNLAFAGLPIDQLNAGAEIRLTESSLTFSGSVSGGSLGGAGAGSAEATILVNESGIFLNGAVSLAPLQFGVFRISGADGGNLGATLDDESLRIDSGARLAIQGIAEDMLTLNEFAIKTDGDFLVSVASGSFVVPGYFALTEGSSLLRSVGGVVTFEMTAPRMIAMPGSDFETELPTPLENLLVESTGRLYYNSGNQTINLPHTFAASGRLEFGYEPDANAPLLAVDFSPIQFGLIDTGKSATRTLQVSNAGGSQLLVGASVQDVTMFSVTPNLLSLVPGEVATLTIRFTPNVPGALDTTLELAHNTVTSPTTISLSGQGRAVPIFYQSADSIDFGEQPVGGGALRRVFISNIGHAPMEVSIPPVASRFTFGGVPLGGMTIDPGDSYPLFVTFKPDAVDSFSDTIDITANDDIGSHQISLSGSGALQRWWTQRDSGPALRSMTGNWAVGDDGTLLTRFTADGESWVSRFALGNINLSRIFSNNPSGFGATYAVGRSGTVLQLSGNDWTPIADPVVAFGGNQFLGGATYGSSSFLMLVGERGLMVRESNFDVYTAANSGTLEDLHDVAFLPLSLVGVAVGSDGTMLRTTNGGASWSPVSLPAGVNGVNLTLRSVEFSTSGVGLIAGDFGNVFRSSANGLNWTKINSPSSATLYDVKFDGTTDAYISGASGTFMKSADSGSSWEIEGTTAATQNLFGVNAYEGAVWTVGQGGFIQHRPVDPPEGPIFGLSTGMLDFGTIGVGASKRMQVTVHNRGTDTLEISSITGGDLFTPSPTSMSIPPGGQQVLFVVFHPNAATDTPPNSPTRVIRFDTNMERVDHYMQVRGAAKTSAWTQIGSATSEYLLDVQFPTPDIGYAIYSGGVIKTIDGGATWTDLPNVNPTGEIKAMHWLTATTGVIGGDNNNAPWAKRTTNGGAIWVAASFSGVSGPIADLSFAPGEDSRGYAVTERVSTGQLNTDGMIIRTLNGGASWTATPTSRPGTFSSGSAVYSYNPFRLYVSSGGNVYRSQDSGSSWETIFELGGAFDIQAIHTVGLFNGFLGGTGGLMRRTDEADAKTPVWEGLPTFSGRDIRDIQFVTQDRGWVVTGGSGIGSAAAIYRTEDGGVTWKEEFAINDGSFNGVWGVGSAGDLAFAVGTDGRIWKYEPFTPEPTGLASIPAFVDLGETAPNQTLAKSIEITNLGDATLNILQVQVENQNVEAFAISEPLATTLAPDESTTMDVSFTAATAGEYAATLSVVTDGASNLMTSELSASVVVEPQVVIFDTEPTGLTVNIDGQDFTAPVAFTVIADASASDEWEPGSFHTISVAEEQIVDDVTYLFQAWTPADEREFEISASAEESIRYVARYVQSVTPSVNALGAVVPASISVAAVSPPEDVPAGPWLRISNASLNVPALGDLDIDGSMFVSSEQFTAALDTGAFRIPDSPELLEVTAGSWRIDYLKLDNSASMALRADAPGVELFNVPAAPPSQLVFDFEADGDFEASFATLGDTLVIPGIFVVGPSSVALTRANAFHTLDLNGTLRLLRKPDGTWAVSQTLDFSAAEGPFTHDITDLPDPILDLGFMSLETDGSSNIRISRANDGAFGLAMNNFDLVLFGRSFANLSGSIDGTGQASFIAAAPASPFEIGPMRLEVTGDTSVEWNVKTGSLSAVLPAGKLKASGVAGWPSGGIDFPGFTIDSNGDFERKINLPTFTFNGISLASGGNQANNYVLLKRGSGVVSVKVRDERDFFGNEFKLALDVSSSGGVTGTFSGSFSIDPVFFGKLDFGAISLIYDDSEPSYQFRGRFRLAKNDFAIEFGSGGSRFRHLNCDGPGLDSCETGLFEITTP